MKAYQDWHNYGDESVSRRDERGAFLFWFVSTSTWLSETEKSEYRDTMKGVYARARYMRGLREADYDWESSV